MSDTQSNRDSDRLISEFQDQIYYNDLLAEAVRMQQLDVALSIIDRDDFQLDPDKKYDNDYNLLMASVELGWDELIDKVLKQPKPILEKLYSYEKERPYRPNFGLVCLALEKNNLAVIQAIKEKDLAFKASSCLVVSSIQKASLDIIKSFPWSKELLNDGGLLYMGKVKGINLDWKVTRPASEAILRERWDIAEHLIRHPNFDPEKNLLAYKIAKKMRRHSPEAREIADLILEVTTEKSPKLAKRHKRGFLLLGRH